MGENATEATAMNRRSLIKSVIGVAVATAVPAMPFVWREKSFAEIISETLSANRHKVAGDVMANNALMTPSRMRHLWAQISKPS